MIVLGLLVGLLAGCCLLMAAGLLYFPLTPLIHEEARKVVPDAEDPTKVIGFGTLCIGIILLLAALALLTT